MQDAIEFLGPQVIEYYNHTAFENRASGIEVLQTRHNLPAPFYSSRTRNGLTEEFIHQYKSINSKKKILGKNNNNKMPGKNNTRKTYRKKTYKKNKKRTYRRKAKVPRRVPTSPPSSMLVKLNSFHTCKVDPGATDAVSYVTINMNNPIDPLALGTGASMVSTEHHPKYWDFYSSVYDRYEVISTRIEATFYQANGAAVLAVFMVPASHLHKDECLTMLTDTVTFAPRLKEAYKRALVHMTASSTEESIGIKLSQNTNIKKLEGLKKGRAADGGGEFQAQTAASGTENAASRLPVTYIGAGAVAGGGIDLVEFVVLLKISYCVLFTSLTGDQEGAAA